MKDGFIKVAAGSIAVCVGNPTHNAAEIKKRIEEADQARVNLLVLPELCITGYTCGDLFYNELLLQKAAEALEEIRRFTQTRYPVVVLGLPVRHQQKLYNCAAVLAQGNILGFVPKTCLPNHGEFYEMRQFTPASALDGTEIHLFHNEEIPFGSHLLFQHAQMEDYCFGIEICEDLWAPCPPSGAACAAGAMLIANPSASNEVISKDAYRRLLVSATSARLMSGYIYCNAGPEESTQDLVFSRHHLIAENGAILAENSPFENQNLLITEIDLQRLAAERHQNTSFTPDPADFQVLVFEQEIIKTPLSRHYLKNPFIPADERDLNRRAGSILQMQAYGLKKRLEHTKAKCAVIGISGGLDSTLALLVAVRAMSLLKRPAGDILAVTMPCFGTSNRTKTNALNLCRELGVTLKEVDITHAVRRHFLDIDQDENNYDVTFENAQARERTQVLMDLANQRGGLLIGTGDLSELALGWATYNGDHMSMYGVNASVPKTLVRFIVRYEAERAPQALRDVLLDILDTPVSPELLPVNQNGELSQKTEDLVGPYELHDFYLYHFIRFGCRPAKLLRLAKYAYEGAYSDETLLYWLKVFLRRFFSQQFKRSCLPDGPKVGSVSLSPRGDWRMPSDASAEIWLQEAETL